MGKKQHSKDRMFITKTEGATEWCGAKSKEFGTPFKRLPFYCCALTFTQFEVPVCTSDGSVFDIMHIMPYINKYGRHPVTGAPLKKDDLIPLTFHKNQEGEYHCPVLNKVFTEFTHIVAVKTTGNVFCYEAIKEFNIETKNWKDLLTDEPFSREDIITIQNPNALDTKVLVDFDHVKKNLKIDDEESKKMESDPSYNINVIGDIKQMLKELGTEKAKEIALQSLASDSRRRRKSGWPPHNVSMGGGRSSCSSSGEEDGDAEWMAAINSVTSSATHASNGASRQDKDGKHKPKHYQIKVGRLLEDILDKTIEVVSERALIVEEDPPAEDVGVRLFRSAPRGIVFDQREELHGPKKKPKIVPGEELHEKSKKFRKQLQSVAVDGADIIVAASRECQKSLAKVEARESAAKTAAKREEERVAELKRVRGERWLPFIAREMRVNAQSRR